jgi:CheY-like chemotaxis protein
VDVADTGIGMNDEAAERLFAEFAQADHSISRKFGGTGLGLAISRKLARLMHGDVSVSSREGEGSVFSFTFRAAPALMPASGEDETERDALRGEHSLQGLRCLLVDDNAVNRKVVRLLLKPAKMDLVDAENGRDALDLLAAQPFDLVLLDVHMPVMDGIAAIKQIRESTESWRDVPVIALTADAMTGDRERLMALGMTGYVTKPVDQRTLVSEIMRVCGQARDKALALTAAAQ